MRLLVTLNALVAKEDSQMGTPGDQEASDK